MFFPLSLSLLPHVLGSRWNSPRGVSINVETVSQHSKEILSPILWRHFQQLIYWRDTVSYCKDTFS